jgi:hypothetical protein
MNPTANAVPYRYDWWPLLICAAGITAYCLPWLTNPGVGLSFGAYDLAEWTSLHPAVRGGNPALLTSLLLRLPLACIGLVTALLIWKHSPIKRILFIFVLGIALLPPLEFFTQYRDDLNYQQQFGLALVTVIAGLSSIAIRHERWRNLVIIGTVLLGTASAVGGLIHGYTLMRGFELETRLGSGGLLFVILSVILGIIQFWRNIKSLLKQTR